MFALPYLLKHACLIGLHHQVWHAYQLKHTCTAFLCVVDCLSMDSELCCA